MKPLTIGLLQVNLRNAFREKIPELRRLSDCRKTLGEGDVRHNQRADQGEEILLLRLDVSAYSSYDFVAGLKPSIYQLGARQAGDPETGTTKDEVEPAAQPDVKNRAG